MDAWLLGYCLQCPDGSRFGRIAPLATLRKNAAGEFVVDRPAEELADVFGPSGLVFWPQNPAPPQDVSDCIVRFRCIPSPEHGDPETSRDWMRVLRAQNGGWDVQRHGFRLVDQGPDVQWHKDPRWIRSAAEGDRLFIRDRAGSRLIGPWRVGNEVASISGARQLLAHPLPNKAFSFPVKSLKSDSLFHDYIPALRREQPLEFLLYAPEESLGAPIDLATSKQLAKWLIERVVAAAPSLISQLDKEAQGWRGRIRDEIEGYLESDRQIFRDRWERLEGILEDLVFEAEEASRLLDDPKFQSRVDDLVRAAVEEKITAKAAEIEAAAQNATKQAIDALERQVGDVERRYVESKAKLDEVASELQARMSMLAERERAVSALSAHLDDSRERLARDIALYQSLLPGGVQPSVVSNDARTGKPPCRPLGEPIESESEFIDKRLWPIVDRWHRGQPRSMAVALHAAICGSKATLLPSPAWARAYADALGGTARLTVVNVQPAWLSFEDLWRGGLARCWERAILDPTAIELLLLRDFNRALPQCYARPILDLIAGFTEELPDPAGGVWPHNLRLLACTAASDESLPLTREVVCHFAAVQREAVVTSGRAEPPGEGHVPFESWTRWCNPALASEPDSELIGDFGPLARSTAAEVAAIARNLQATGMGAREAMRTARDVRVSDPTGYLEAQDGPPRCGR
jgi:hypothetical protein